MLISIRKKKCDQDGRYRSRQSPPLKIMGPENCATVALVQPSHTFLRPASVRFSSGGQHGLGGGPGGCTLIAQKSYPKVSSCGRGQGGSCRRFPPVRPLAAARPAATGTGRTSQRRTRIDKFPRAKIPRSVLAPLPRPERESCFRTDPLLDGRKDGGFSALARPARAAGAGSYCGGASARAWPTAPLPAALLAQPGHAGVESEGRASLGPGVPARPPPGSDLRGPELRLEVRQLLRVRVFGQTVERCVRASKKISLVLVEKVPTVAPALLSCLSLYTHTECTHTLSTKVREERESQNGKSSSYRKERRGEGKERGRKES